MIPMLVSLACAVSGAVLARLARIPSASIIGSFVGAAFGSYLQGPTIAPPSVYLVVLSGVGLMIGMSVTREMVAHLRSVLVPALVSAALLSASGIAVAFSLRAFGVALAGDVLATSPGALSMLSAAAFEHDADAPVVVVFHFVRLLVILMTLPLLLRLLPESKRHPVRTPGRAKRSHAAIRSETTQMIVVAAAALIGGWLARAARLPGGVVVGSTTMASTVSLLFARPLHPPPAIPWTIMVGLGWIFGAMVDRQTALALPAALLPAVASAAILILSGILIARLVLVMRPNFTGAVLATSPGALEMLLVLAATHDADPLEVTVFHTVRLLLVIASLPLLLLLLP